MISGCAAPASPATACRLSRTALSGMPAFLAMPAATRGSTHGMAKWAMSAGFTSVALNRSASAAGTILL